MFRKNNKFSSGSIIKRFAGAEKNSLPRSEVFIALSTRVNYTMPRINFVILRLDQLSLLLKQLI